MAKKNSGYKIGIQFNTDDPRQRDAINFLGLCGYRRNKIIGIMVEEFVTKYKLNDADPEYIKQFVDSYEFIKKAVSSIPEELIFGGLLSKKSGQQEQGAEIKTSTHSKKSTEMKHSSVSKESGSSSFDSDAATKALSAFGL